MLVQSSSPILNVFARCNTKKKPSFQAMESDWAAGNLYYLYIIKQSSTWYTQSLWQDIIRAGKALNNISLRKTNYFPFIFCCVFFFALNRATGFSWLQTQIFTCHLSDLFHSLLFDCNISMCVHSFVNRFVFTITLFSSDMMFSWIYGCISVSCVLVYDSLSTLGRVTSRPVGHVLIAGEH